MGTQKLSEPAELKIVCVHVSGIIIHSEMKHHEDRRHTRWGGTITRVHVSGAHIMYDLGDILRFAHWQNRQARLGRS